MATRSRAALLLCLLIAAGAARPGRAAVVRGCEAEILGASVGLFCSAREADVACCWTLDHTVRRGGLGCLCRIAAETPVVDAALNATDLLRLYAACSAPEPPPPGLASACDAGAHAPTVAPRPPPKGAPSSVCVDGRILADQMELFCGRRSPNAPCCEAVVGAVGWLAGGDVPCFCAAAVESGVGVRGVVDLYIACGGLRTGAARRVANMCPRHASMILT